MEPKGRIEIAKEVTSRQAPFRQASAAQRARTPDFTEFLADKRTKFTFFIQTGKKAQSQRPVVSRIDRVPPMRRPLERKGPLIHSNEY